MQVKCQICGKSIDRSTAYKVVVGGTNKYFCSEEEFSADKARKNYCTHFTGRRYADATNYDLTLCTSKLGIDAALDQVLRAAEHI